MGHVVNQQGAIQVSQSDFGTFMNRSSSGLSGPPAAGGFGFLTMLPFFFQLLGTGLSIFSAIQERKRRERIVALSDERINLEIKAAEFEEIEIVEQEAFVVQLEHQQVFNKDNPIGLSWTEAALAGLGQRLDRRQNHARRLEDFKRAKRFEAQDIREGNTISSTALFTQTLSDSATALVQGFTLQQQIRSLMAAGDLQGVQGKLFEQQLLQGDAALENAALQRTLYQKQVEEINNRLGRADDPSLLIGLPEKARAGLSPPQATFRSAASPAELGQFFAAGKQSGRGNLTGRISDFMRQQNRLARIRP